MILYCDFYLKFVNVYFHHVIIIEAKTSSQARSKLGIYYLPKVYFIYYTQPKVPPQSHFVEANP